MVGYKKVRKKGFIAANYLAVSLILSSIVFKSLLLQYLNYESVFFENDSTRYLDLASNFLVNYVSANVATGTDSFYITPGYPLFLSILSSFEIRQIIFCQFCILGMTQFICYSILKNCFRPRMAIFGLITIVLESSMNLESFHILTETLFGLFFACFLYFFSTAKKSKIRMVIAGGFLGTSLLIRPVAQILIIALLITILIAKQKMNILICILISITILSGWLIRNYNIYGVSQLSGIQSLNLLYYEGAGAAAIAKSQTLEKAQSEESARESSALGEAAPLNEIVNYRQQRGLYLIKSNFLGFIELHLKGSIKILLGPGSATIDDIASKFSYGKITGIIYKYFSILLSSILALLSFYSILIFVRKERNTATDFEFFVIVAFIFLLISSGGANAYSRFRVPIVPLEILMSMYSIYNLRQRSVTLQGKLPADE